MTQTVIMKAFLLLSPNVSTFRFFPPNICGIASSQSFQETECKTQDEMMSGEWRTHHANERSSMLVIHSRKKNQSDEIIEV